jgi:primosomal protein N' (replication factor Y)
MRRIAPTHEGISVLGPAEAPMAIVRERHRFRILVHATLGVNIQTYLRQWLAVCPKETGNLRVQVDIDPQSFL